MAAITKIPVSLIGVGLVGSQVIVQLSSPLLSPYFHLTTLSNSAHTLSLSPSTTLPSELLLDLLPPSSSPLPKTPTGVDGATLSSFVPKDLVATLSASGSPHILIDCTSSLPITELYPLAISSGLSIVTPNKKGFSSSSTLFSSILAASTSSPKAGLVYLEATVGAGLPIISTLKDLVKTGDEIHKIEGVLSGTLSYIFNEFSKPGGGVAPKFSDVVKIAKDSGYTEPHPADDLSGSDVARKLTILSRLLPSSASLPTLSEGFASLSTETLIPKALEGIATGEEFVKALEGHDEEFEKVRKDAESQGKVLRYVGVIDVKQKVVKCGLGLYPYSHPFASSLSGSDNIISFHTLRYPSPLIIQGAGAGAAVTAAGVVGDVIKVAERYGSSIGGF